MSRTYVIGTRVSNLAMWQAQFVQWLLEEQWPDDQFTILGIKTSGDQTSGSIGVAGGKGLYVKELQEALLEKKVDVCVHSLKDLPTYSIDGLALAGVVERGEIRDAFVSRDKVPLSKFGNGMKIGTSSPRRKAQLRAQNLSVEVVDIRGNVNKRLEKMQQGEVDGLVLAAVGLLRLGAENMITEHLSPHIFVPAPAQGAIGLECRDEDDDLQLKLKKIHDDASGQAVVAERAFLAELGGNCSLPLGAYCEMEQFQMRLSGYLSDIEGRSVMMDTAVGLIGHGDELGRKLAQRFLAQGAARFLEPIDEV